MLQADKQVLLAGVKRNALELRQRELEFHVERYTNLATQASVVAGFSFESLVELEVPEDTPWLLSSCYFVLGSSAMALALYVLCIASFACVFGHRLALQGPHGSLERAVHILIQHRYHIFATAGLSLGCLVGAAVLMAWIKMGAAKFVVTLIFLAFGYFVYWRMALMIDVFAIPDDQLVTGATRVQNASSCGATIDLARLNPASRSSTGAASVRAPPAMPREGGGGTGGNVASSASAAAGGGGGPSAVGGSVAGAAGGGYVRLADGPPADSSHGGHQSQARAPSAAGATAASGAGARTLHHEGHLFKRGEHSFLGGEQARRRYFVLRGVHLFYFKSWEDYAASSSTLRWGEPPPSPPPNPPPRPPPRPAHPGRRPGRRPGPPPGPQPGPPPAA